jgi:hypothetical protein
MTKKLLLLFLFYSCFAQSQDILWEKSYGGLHADYLFDAQPTADYGFILAGSFLFDRNKEKRLSDIMKIRFRSDLLL